MQETEWPALAMQGTSNCRHLTAGHKLTLQRHFNADGQYVLAEVSHEGAEGSFRSDDTDAKSHYTNTFSCFPYALPYRPPRVTRRPTVVGPQTGVVVGPAGEEIFTDKYGRIKVQFHWDREGKNDADSSCWLRVGTMWAGQNWGGIHIPRMGQEVIVSFLEGDPDRPLVLGSVYNPDQMPAYTLPEHKTVSTLKSRSTKKGSKDNFNEMRFEDLKGKEQVFFHGERDMDQRVKSESREWVGGNRHLIVKKNQKESVEGNKHLTTTGDVMEKVNGGVSLTVTQGIQQKTGTKFAHESGQEIHLKAGMKVIIEAGVQISLKGPGGFVDIGPTGVTIQGLMVLINSGGAAGSGSGSSPSSPEAPDVADDGSKFDKL
jgi:type VI secretion system secreted protein VgrG